jgi:hypothetical protein
VEVVVEEIQLPPPLAVEVVVEEFTKELLQSFQIQLTQLQSEMVEQAELPPLGEQMAAMVEIQLLVR